MIQFNDYTAKVQDILQKKANDEFSALGSLIATITSHSIDMGKTFPNITMREFEVQVNETSR